MEQIYLFILGLLLGFTFMSFYLTKFKSKKHSLRKIKCRLVLFVRLDLQMGKGKIGAQCSHATLKVFKATEDSEYKWDSKFNVYSVASEQ